MSVDATIMATADRLYFSGGYRTINRGMLDRVLREAEAATIEDRVVAVLRYPLAADALDKFVRGLTPTHGKGLVILTDHPLAYHGFMVIARPEG
jgi:hypothetical protein